MVLAYQVGRARSPWRGFWLSALTFNLYSFYWDVQAHDEAYKQFELAREGREQALPWYMLGFLFPFLRLVYMGQFLGNVRYLRDRFGFARTMSTGAFMGLLLPGQVALYVGVTVGIAILGQGFGVQEEVQPDGTVEDVPYVEDGGLVAAGATLAGLMFLAYVVLTAIAYMRLQSELNGVWRAYEARLGQMLPKAPQGTPPPAPAPSTGWASAPAAPQP